MLSDRISEVRTGNALLNDRDVDIDVERGDEATQADDDDDDDDERRRVQGPPAESVAESRDTSPSHRRSF